MTRTSSITVLNIVVPCYNEEEALPETSRRLSELLDRMAKDCLIEPSSGVYFVDDGSCDQTWNVIVSLRTSQPSRFHGIKLSRNRGHQNALLAGLRNAPGDIVVSIDADLQDDIDAIEQMVREFHAGCDIVYGVREVRDADTLFKRKTACLYYILLKQLGVEIVPHHADFRLMSRRVLDALSRYDEVNLFIRAIVPLLGFKTARVHYRRGARCCGESKYPLSKMLALAVDGLMPPLISLQRRIGKEDCANGSRFTKRLTPARLTIEV